jgi:heme-degrading monooxygenase HmoA
VVTRWADDESFQAWMGSQAFASGGQHGQHGQQPGADGAAQRPVSSGAELLAFEVVDLKGAQGG